MNATAHGDGFSLPIPQRDGLRAENERLRDELRRTERTLRSTVRRWHSAATMLAEQRAMSAATLRVLKETAELRDEAIVNWRECQQLLAAMAKSHEKLVAEVRKVKARAT